MTLTLKVEAIGGKSGQDSKFPPPGTATLYQK